MHSDNSVEHFVTLFDSNYLPMGICLHDSLMKHAPRFHLWIVCMDELVEKQLHQLGLPNVTPIPLREVETEAMLAIKDGRTRGEYCWTLTPFTPQFVFDRDDTAARVTYVDTDLFFFDSPQLLIKEFEDSGKDVLITEHAYGPEYDQSTYSGLYCVQFMTFRRTPGGIKVMQWWQDRCIEWCFFRYEDGKLGDQKYLDDWTERFSCEVHVLKQVEKTLAPWNVRHFTELYPSVRPVLYHFHSLRFVDPRRVLLYAGYRIGGGGWIYSKYVQALKSATGLMRKSGMPIPSRPAYGEKFHFLKMIRRLFLGMERYARI
jgi:hypothetical protein